MPADHAPTAFDGVSPIRYKDPVLNRTIAAGRGPGRRRSIVSVARASAWLGLMLVASGVVGGCGRKIGDSCTTSADCDPTRGTRTCDLSQPGGYCIVEGCDARSCPEDSVCVRFFPTAFLSVSCEDDKSCDAEEVCVPIKPGDEPPRVCARRALEKRVCVQSCGDDGDCRGGYRCVMTGTDGTLPLTLTPNRPAKFCVPQ